MTSAICLHQPKHFAEDLLDGRNWQWPLETVVVLACNRQTHISDVDLGLLGVVLVKPRLLDGLSDVVVHKLEQLVGHILLVVFNAWAS